MTDLIVWADEIAPASAVSQAGAKMGRLSELHHAGVAVPVGFTVTIEAYARHCAAAGLDRVVDEVVKGLSDDAAEADVERAAERIRSAFLERPLDEGLAEAVTGAYARLGERCQDPFVRTAVRSSATGEDSADASFAGIFDTYLGVSGADAVINAVRACWASLFTGRALAYRRRRGISHHDMPIAVGVLELVDAVASGVAFSLHPVSGKRDRVVVDANWGWGEAVVQGVVSPDHTEVGKEDKRVLFYDVADKRVLSTFDPQAERVVEVDMPEGMRQSRVLDDDDVRAVADAVLAIEEHYDYPVDVEWVLGRQPSAAPTVIIVQARPVTAVEPAAESVPPTWDPTAAATRWAFGGRG